MGRNFERGNQRCGYYDEAQLPHGGPEGNCQNFIKIDQFEQEFR